MPAFEIANYVLPYKVVVLGFTSVFIFQITKKAEETAAQGAASEVPDTDTEGSPDADVRPSTTVSTTATKIQTGRVKRSVSTEQDDDILACIDNRSQQLINLQQQLLTRIKPEGDQERVAFADWVHSALVNMDHGIWRRCQKDISDIVYRYIRENDAARRPADVSPAAHGPSAVGPPAPPVYQGPSASGMPHALAPQQQLWQPGPQHWPSTMQNPTSVSRCKYKQDSVGVRRILMVPRDSGGASTGFCWCMCPQNADVWYRSRQWNRISRSYLYNALK